MFCLVLNKMALSIHTYYLSACLLLLSSTFTSSNCVKYTPTWESLDSRPLPEWYDEAKLGIFIHWGVFSVPSFRSEWFWWDWQGAKDNDTVQFMKENYRPDFTYADFEKQFTAEFFVASEWAKIFQESGAKYIVFVSKHHEGFTNWPSKYSFNWNSMDLGPGRDIVGELANATKDRNLHFGLYHSLFEWFNPLYLQDKKDNFSSQQFVFKKTLPELYELVNQYKPDVVWSDGDWEAKDSYWQSKEFLAWLYNDSPVKDSVVTNDRWGQGVMCHHGGYFTCSDRYNPHHLLQHKWENAMTIDKQSWGYRRNAELKQILSIEEILEELVTTVSCNGNVLLNVGPTHDGTISPIYQERLSQLGSWLKVNGEGIYSSRPWTYQNDTQTPGVWYTSKPKSPDSPVYAFVLQWPDNFKLHLAAPTPSPDTQVTMLGLSSPLAWTAEPGGGLTVKFPPLSVKHIPCQWAWTLKLTKISN